MSVFTQIPDSGNPNISYDHATYSIVNNWSGKASEKPQTITVNYGFCLKLGGRGVKRVFDSKQGFRFLLTKIM